MMKKNKHIETDVFEILEKDGVVCNDLFNANKPVFDIKELIKSNFKNKIFSWSHRVVNTENNCATLICQQPGEGNRLHYHPDWNEWWYIVAGKWEVEIEGNKHIVEKDQVVFLEKKKWHKIVAIGNKPAIRLAISKDKVQHIYD